MIKTSASRHALTLTLALAFGAAAAPALSGPKEIVVSSDSAVVEMSQDLDRQLDLTARQLRENHGDGYAIVRFARGENGRPANVSFYRRSGSPSVDRLARTAVRRLGGQGGLPDTGVAGQTYQANIVLANSEESARKLTADLARAEKQRLASSLAERTVLALSAGARIAS